MYVLLSADSQNRHSSVGRESACSAGDAGSIPGLGRSPGEGITHSSYSGLENSMDCLVHGVAKSRTRLSDFHFQFFTFKKSLILKALFESESGSRSVETVSDFIFWAPNSLQMVIAAMKLKDAYSLEGKLGRT